MHFVIGQAGDDRREHDADGDVRLRQRLDRREAAFGRAGARLHLARQIRIERGHREHHHRRAMRRELREQIDIARDQMILGDDADGIAELRQDFQALAGDLQLTLDRLIAIGDAADGDRARLPLGRIELFAQQLRRIFLDEDFGFKIQAGGEAEVFMRRPRVAVDAPVLAAAIRVDRLVEMDVGRVVARDDALRVFPGHFRLQRRGFGNLHHRG